MKIVPGKILDEVLSLLYWSMLAACTVGPGTVVTCARAGTEQGLQLVWALVFATLMAFILQEGSARLTITSGKSLGECLRMKYSHLKKFYNVAIICWVVAIGVYIGNTFYEVNCWAGGMSAIYIIPGAENTAALRWSCCFGYAIVVYGLLFLDKTHHLSVGLGIVLIGMAVLFLVVVCKLGLDWKEFGLGLIPTFPAGSSNIILSLVGTTSIGFNLFLGSSMAKDSAQKLGRVQRGIAFSVIGAFTISVLIMIVGDGATLEEGADFDIGVMADLIEEVIGVVGLWFFILGFIAAAVSSMLAVPLGAAITVDSMFSITGKEEQPAASVEQNSHETKIAEAERSGAADIASPPVYVAVVAPLAYNEDLHPSRPLSRWIYQSIMLSMILVSTVTIACNVDTVQVIQIAQIVNGCLLPFFAFCLLLCLNDVRFMGERPQQWWANIFLVMAVTITFFLAFNVIIQNALKSVLESEGAKLGLAAGLAVLLMSILLLFTSLRKDIWRSFNCFSQCRCCGNNGKQISFLD